MRVLLFILAMFVPLITNAQSSLPSTPPSPTSGPAANSGMPFPARPIHLLVPAPAGGGADLLARSLAAHLSESRGWNVVVERKNQVYQMELHDGSYLLAKTDT